MRRVEAWIPAQIDVPAWKKTTTARAMLREYWQAVEARIELEKAMEAMREASQGKAPNDALGLAAITQAIAHAKLKLRLLLSPLTADSIKAALDDYDVAIKNQPPLGRLKAQAELFKALPMSALLKAKKDKKLTPGLETRLDAARRDILQTMQTQFLLQNPALAPFVERIIYTGSGARPDWPEYKRLSSDLDFTIVLKEGTTLDNRLKVKATFDQFFTSRTNFAPEEFDIHCFADERPRLSSQRHDGRRPAGARQGPAGRRADGRRDLAQQCVVAPRPDGSRAVPLHRRPAVPPLPEQARRPGEEGRGAGPGGRRRLPEGPVRGREVRVLDGARDGDGQRQDDRRARREPPRLREGARQVRAARAAGARHPVGPRPEDGQRADRRGRRRADAGNRRHPRRVRAHGGGAGRPVHARSSSGCSAR